MSIAQLTAGRTGWSTDSWEPPSRVAVNFPAFIGGALLAVILYAAFDHGAVSGAVNTHVELAVTALSVIGLVPWLWTGTLRVTAPRSAAFAVALLAAFAIWSGITVFWSVAPDQTWIELNRATTDLLVLGLAIAIGSSYARALELIVLGFVLAALAVTVYALGQKLFPGLHVPGVFNLNQAGPLPRLQEPLGYWNALALFLAMAVPAALAVAADGARSRRTRLASLCAIELMLVTIVFTYSRGGLLALGVSLVVAISISGERLRSSMWLALAVVAGLPATVYGLASPQLNTAGVKLGSRELAGLILAMLILLSLIGLVIAARKLLDVEPRIRVAPRRVPGLRRLALAGAVIALLGVVVALSLSPRGLTGTVSHAWNTFTATQSATGNDPRRLLSADSQNRWVWWKEAAGAFSDRPLGGWGAGSFSVVHLLYRRNNLSVQQPHSVPLQFLSETGIIGAILGVGAVVLLLRAGAIVVRRSPRGSDRLLAGAGLAAGLAYAIHSLYDWDWEIPAVTLPALLLLGVVVSSRARVTTASERRADARLGLRAVMLALFTLWLGVFALSVELPELAASKASAALVEASSSSPAPLTRAQSTAQQASALDPLSDAGAKALAAVAIHRGQVGSAQAYLQQAVQRDPSDGAAWNLLSYADLLLHDDAGASQATRNVVALDPQGRVAVYLVRARLLKAPPQASPTAIRTPLARR